MLKAHTYPV